MSERSHSKIRWLWRAALGLIVGAALLGLLARGVDLAEVWAALARLRPAWGVAAAVSVLLTTAAKIARWRGLFPDRRRPKYRELAKALLAGQSANALFPARAGDILRAYLAGRDDQVSVGLALGTVATEKALDVLFLLISAGMAAALAVLPPWLDLPLAGMAIGGLLGLLLVVFWPQHRFLRWVERGSARLPWKSSEWISGFLSRFLQGVSAVRDPRTAIAAGLWSVAIWTLATATNFLLLQSFALSLPLGASVLLVVALHVGVAPPSTPAKLGVFHSIAMLSLEGLGVERALSLPYAVVLYFIVYLPQIVPGVFLLGSSLPVLVQAAGLGRREP